MGAATTTRTWHHTTDLDADEALEVSPRLGIKWFAAPEHSRADAGFGSRTLRVEVPAADDAPVIDAEDVAGSLAGMEHGLSDDDIEQIAYTLDRGGYEADEAAAALLSALGAGALRLTNWEGAGDEVLIADEDGLADARIVGTI